MTRREFEELRDLPDKQILEDIQFGESGDCSPILIFENIRVQNSLGLDVRLNGKYNPFLPSVAFNFRILDVGPICRLEVNGTMHGNSRTHKHALVNEDDPRRNLPTNVTPRPDLDGKTPKQVWAKLCLEAKIKHAGTFTNPQSRKASV